MDGRLAEDMAICGPHAIPHSFFLGGPHRWTEDDRDKHYAWQEMQRQTCKTCGTRAEEWDPEQGGSRYAYTTEVRVCSGCEVLERGQAQMSNPDQENVRGRQLLMVPKG